MPPVVWAYLPGILLLLLASAFFSGSEAAFFSLKVSQRARLASGIAAARLADQLARRSERLLMGILFWNLAINIAYFSLVSKLALVLEQQADSSGSPTFIVPIVSLIVIVIFGEFLPKSIAVQYAESVVQLVAFPLALAIRVLDGILPIIRLVNEASRRIIWPGLQAEKYLELSDLDRAVELSTEDEELFDQESRVLRNVIQLSEIRVEEWMRPRNQFRSFAPPVDLAELSGERTPSGYLLLTDKEGREVRSAVDLQTIRSAEKLDHRHGQTLAVVPWCASMADALTKLSDAGRRVAVIVNELGETIGILTWEDIFEAILHIESNAEPEEGLAPELTLQTDGSWHAVGTAKLRKVERTIGLKIEDENHVTVAGVVQASLHRIPEIGDECHVGSLSFKVIEADLNGQLLVRISRLPDIRELSEEGSMG